MIGAIMVFGLGMVYCWIQAIISHKMRHQAMSSTLSSCTRFILSGLVTVFFIISILSSRLKLAVGIFSRPFLFQTSDSHAKSYSWIDFDLNENGPVKAKHIFIQIDFAQRLILTQRQKAPWRWLNIQFYYQKHITIYWVFNVWAKEDITSVSSCKFKYLVINVFFFPLNSTSNNFARLVHCCYILNVGLISQ